MPEPRRITILGSTGSIGTSALEVVRQFPGRFQVVGLAAHSNHGLLAAQVQEFRPDFAAITEPAGADALEALGICRHIFHGPDAAREMASIETDLVLCAMVGAAGLEPALAALRNGVPIAIANKEPVVMAGRLLRDTARKHDSYILPVDSEHSAIFQCLRGERHEDIATVHLTASGGPFYRRDPATLRDITPEEATRHPTWDMGAKVSVDSATLMNKGLEIIEAMWLFDLPADKLNVVIHPQSIVHSVVEFCDGHMLAHLGVTDMKFPIAFALAYPERVERPMARLDLTMMSSLTFDRPDFSAFPCLAYAREAAARGGTMPAILNAANEIAVHAFCAGRLPFLGIADVVRRTLDNVTPDDAWDLEAVYAADRAARAEARASLELVGTV